MKTKLLRFTLLVAISFLFIPHEGKCEVKKPKPAAETTQSSASFSENVIDNFLFMSQRGAQEKLYLHTDKPYYISGEKIWFKAYLVNAVTNTETTQSRFIEVELIDINDNVVTSSKIKADDQGRFHNCIELKPTLETGNYMLRAYSRWMMNESPDLFFTKELRIENPIDNRIRTSADFSRNSDGTVTAKINISNSDGSPESRLRVEMRGEPGFMRPQRMRTDGNGDIILTFTPPADTVKAVLNASFSLYGYDYLRSYEVPVFGDSFDIQFFPEGGSLIPGAVRQVAFKAVGADGLSVEVEGAVYCDGEMVTAFGSAHRGMGKFGFTPENGKEYIARVRTADGRQAEVPIPVCSSGCSINAVRNNGYIIYRMETTADIDHAKLGIVILTHGELLEAGEFTDLSSGRIELQALSPGINQICAVNKSTGEVIARRLVFVRDPAAPTALIGTDKTDYRAREKVRVDITVSDLSGNPLSGNFSAAVVDADLVSTEENGENIVSYLLLSSELKGVIEEPGYYFAEEDLVRDAHLDLVMLTHGWSRYDVSSVIRGALKPYRFFHEDSQYISGRVEGHLGRKPKNASLALINPVTGYFESVELSDSKNFVLTGLDIPDSTVLLAQVLNKSGKVGSYNLHFEKEEFPEPKFTGKRYHISRPKRTVPDSYLERSLQEYYAEGGMSIMEIAPIVIRGTRSFREASLTSSTMGIPYNPTHSLSHEELGGYSSIWDAILYLPGVREVLTPWGRSLRVRGETPVVFINGWIVSNLELDMYNLADVASIDLLTGVEAATFGLGPIQSTIVVNLKDYAFMVEEDKKAINIIRINVKGYSQPAEFYQPKYEVPEILTAEKRDLRTTLAWVPDINTDGDGKAEITFYTADNKATYELKLEGLTREGQPVSSAILIDRKK